MLSIRLRHYIKALSVITVGFVVFIGFGVLVTRLTVRNLVDVSSVYLCGDPTTRLHPNDLFERIALSLGKSRVMSTTMTQAEVESFTIYHIPLGLITGQSGLMVSVECLPAQGEKNGAIEQTPTLPIITWGTYINKELGISMEIPLIEDSNQLSGGVGDGDTGKHVQVSINLQSGSTIYGYAATGDYSAPKGAPGVGDEGYVVNDGRYYAITRGASSGVEFIPDAIWETSDGSGVLVRYRKKAEELIDYPIPFIQVMVNIPNSIFTGIGFIVVGHGVTQEIVSDEDIETLKKIISTINFI